MLYRTRVSNLCIKISKTRIILINIIVFIPGFLLKILKTFLNN
jgi:hypothetical protein